MGVIFSGALERYPNVRVVLGESGIGWTPYVLDRMDYEWEDQFKSDLDLTMEPSEYWQPVQGHLPVRRNRRHVARQTRGGVHHVGQ